MAKLENLVPLILKWEGGYVNDPMDKGGATNRGVTLSTWRNRGYDKNDDGLIGVEDLKLINQEDMVECILRPHYWNRWQGDRIDSQALANILVDWVWCSGKYGITIPQGLLGVPQDGIVGESTLHVLNTYPDPKQLFEKIKQLRRAYLSMICIDRPANKRFLVGWLNRLNNFKWIPMALLFCVLLSCRTVQKTETLNTEETVETFRETSLHTARKEFEERNEHLSKDQNETRTTETIIAEFNTLDFKPVLKKLQIKRTVSDREVHTEKREEKRTTETGMQNEEQTVETLRDISLYTKSKEKPVMNSYIWWIAGGAGVLLLLLTGWKMIGK